MADRNAFLKLMRVLESSGGKNTNHRTMEGGMHKGQAAIGEYGMMPNTVKEMAGRRMAAGDATELDKMLVEADPNSIKAILAQNPDKYKQYSEQLADHVLDKSGGDPAAAASGWLYGHNMSKDKMDQALVGDPEYQDRIERAIAEQGLSSQPIDLIDSLKTTPKEQMYSSPTKLDKMKKMVDDAGKEADTNNTLDVILKRQQSNGPQLRQGTGNERPYEDFRQTDEINRAVENAAGFVGGGIAKIGPKALNAAQALMVTPASKFGRVVKVGENVADLGKVKHVPEKTLEALKGATKESEPKLSIEELRKRVIDVTKRRNNG